MSFIPLLKMIIEENNYPVVSEDSLDDWAISQDVVMLYFGGDGERLDETADVAVVLPMLDQHFKGQIQVAVVDRASERQLQLRYRFNAFPTLVFLKRGQYLGAISRMQDWSDYVSMVEEILKGEPGEAPAFRLPHGCGPDESKDATAH
jgi:hydrogenase-1 operon protein HyaE